MGLTHFGMAGLVLASMLLSGCADAPDGEQGPPTDDKLTSWSFDFIESETPYLLARVSSPDQLPIAVDVTFDYFVVISEAPPENPNAPFELRDGHCGGLIAGKEHGSQILPGESPVIGTHSDDGTGTVNDFPIRHTAQFHGELVLEIESGSFMDVLVWIDGYEADPQAGSNSGTLSLSSDQDFSVQRLSAEGICLTRAHEYEENEYQSLAGNYEGSLTNSLPGSTNSIGYIDMWASNRNEITLQGDNETIASWSEPIRGWFSLHEPGRRIEVTQSSENPPEMTLWWVALQDDAQVLPNKNPAITIE